MPEEKDPKPGIIYENGPECPACGDTSLLGNEPHSQPRCLARLTAIYNRHANMAKAWEERLQKGKAYWEAQRDTG